VSRPAARLWAHLGSAVALSIVLYTCLVPARPASRLPAAVAVIAGGACGAALFAALVRCRPRLALGARSPLVFAGLQGYLALRALTEEILWRRVALGELLETGAALALLVSTVGFAMAHGARAPTHVGTGATFGALYLLTGKLAASIAAHWAYNAFVTGHVDRLRTEGRLRR
jgi:membrane protease YdiL (CAAX protease family)